VVAEDKTGARKILTLRVDVERSDAPKGKFRYFQAAAKNWSWVNACFAIAAMSLVDKGEPTVTNTLREEWGFEPDVWPVGRVQNVTYKDETSKGLKAFLAGDSRTALVCVRGTNPTDLSNLATDALVFPAKDGAYANDPNARIHSGFRDAANLLWPTVKAHLKARAETGAQKRVWLAGHSLGAAVVTLLASRIQMEFADYEVGGVFAFGPPSVGNSEFRDEYNARVPRHWRMINGADPVPRLLAPPLYFGVGQLWYIDHDPPFSISEVSDNDGRMVGHFLGEVTAAAAMTFAAGIPPVVGHVAGPVAAILAGWHLLLKHHFIPEYMGPIHAFAGERLPDGLELSDLPDEGVIS
jgi:hypothetical protein